MKRVVVVVVAFAVACSARAATQQPAEPRFLLRVDAGLLAQPNIGAGGSGGGIQVSAEGGTGAGLNGGGGAQLGLEVRLSRWLYLDTGVGWYGPSLEVARGDPASGTTLDDRSASVDLRTAALGLVLSPPKLRSRTHRLAFCVFAQRIDVSGVPPSLGLSVENGDTGLGFDARGELFFSKDRHWGIGMALSFSDMGPAFTDLETGAGGTLQVSGLTLRLGLRGTW